MSNIPPVPPYPPSGPSLNHAQFAQTRNGSQQKTLFGMRRWIAVSLTIVVSLIVVGVGTVLGVTAYTNHKEEVSAARTGYQASFEEYEGSRDGLSDQLADAKQTLDSIEAKDIEDASLLEDLAEEYESSQGVFDQFGGRADFDLMGSSVDDVNAEVVDVDGAVTELSTAAEGLSGADDAVRDSFDDKAEAEAAKRAAEEEEEAKKSATSISYEKLFRSGSSLTGEYFTFEGEIIQDVGMGTYRVNVTKEPGYTRNFWEDTVLLTISPAPDTKLLEDDIITFIAQSEGTESYESIMGATIEVPALTADGADVKLSGQD